MRMRLNRLWLGSLLLISLATGVARADSGALDDKLRTAFEAGELAGLHGVLILQSGETLAESYFPGEDQNWGVSLGVREHGPDTLHDLRSVTKSVVGLLYGIALAEGKVPATAESLIAQFPDYADLGEDPERSAIQIGHALSMKMGTEWNEDLPYSDPRNSEIAMENADDRYRFVLDRPMVSEPGDTWVYNGGATAIINGGATAIIGRLIADGVGMPVDEYAAEKLFAPLGITDYEWTQGADGVPSAASGLRMSIRDLAKIGQLVIQNGEFDGRQIVPSDWLEVSFTPRTILDGGLRYGYFWWLAGYGEPPAWAAGFGNGGQRLTIQPELGLVVVVFAGNYNQPDAWKLPVKVIEEFLVPAMKEKIGGQ